MSDEGVVVGHRLGASEHPQTRDNFNYLVNLIALDRTDLGPCPFHFSRYANRNNSETRDQDG